MQSRRGLREPGVAISPAPESSISCEERGARARDEAAERRMVALLTLWQAGVPAPPSQELRAGVFDTHGNGMDITWLTDRIAVGGGIWTAENMAKVGREGVTHIIDMQIEFDDTPLGEDCGIAVLWNPTDDDFTLKPPELFQRGVQFAQAALEEAGRKVFIHCAAGVHRAPMMALALLASMGWELEDAMELIESRRPVADFADIYVRSVEGFLAQVETEEK